MDGRNARRRDDRPAADPFKPWVSTDKHPPDYDSDRRRQRSATFPAHSYDSRSYPSHDARYNEPKQSSRTHRQDPHYPSAAPYPSHHHSSTQAPSTSKAYQHATRPSAQYSSSGYHYPQPSSYHPSHTTPTYPVASSSRKPHPDPPDSKPSRRPAPPTHQSAYDQVSSGEEIARTSRHPSRPVHSSTHPPLTAPANQVFWNPPKEMPSSRRYKDTHRDRDRDLDKGRDKDKERGKERDRDRDREREKPSAELETRYRDRARAERHRERDRERATEVRHQDSSRGKYQDRRKDSDTEGGLYTEQRNASKASLSGRDGYPTSVRESGNNPRRYRTEDGMAFIGRRHQPENTQNPITTMPSQSTSVPQPDVQQTGEPPPAPRVMPVYLPPKVKSQRSHREGRPSTGQGAQSGSDTERPTGKHRMERTPSGPAVQRSDGHTLGSTRDRGSHDAPIGLRDDVKRLEGKYGTHQDTRQPLVSIDVDIPLVTPGFNASALPTETRATTVPQIVSIRAGQGPSDLNDVHLKSSAISHSDTPQEIIIHPPQSTSGSIVKSSSYTRSQSSENRAQSDRPVVEYSRAEPRGDDLSPGQRVSVHEPGQALAAPISRASHARGNPDVGVDNSSSSYPHSRPPSRSTQRTSANNIVPPAVLGPRPLRSVSQGPQTNETLTRPPSVAQYTPTTPSAPNQLSVPPSPAHPSSGSSPKARYVYGSLPSAQPSHKTAQLHGMSPSHLTSIQQGPSVPSSVYATPIIVSQTLTAASRSSTRDGTQTDVLYTSQQSTDRQSTTNIRPGLRQTSDSTTVQASWVVQTPATAKRTKISREDKYLGDHHFIPETPHTQLRQVLSQDDDSFPRASLSIMKASQATTPATSSQRNSPGSGARDVSFGTPRGTLVGSSPKSRSAKEAPTPEHIPRQTLQPHLAEPPQIAVVGATPVAIPRNLPYDRVDHALLAPPFPAPTRVSRTTSSSQDQQSQPLQPAVRSTSSAPYQPQLALAAHAPSLLQPYRPPSRPVPEDNSQCSPPPLPVPPPRVPEDFPSPPIETRPIEIIPTRSQNDGYPQAYPHSFPEVQSEMFHMPSQSLAPSQHPIVPPPRTTQLLQPTKLDSSATPTPRPNGTTSVSHTDMRSSKLLVSQPDDVEVAHQEFSRPIPVFPLQSSAPPARMRPKVTVEDIPEDSPVWSGAVSTGVPMITPSTPASRPVQSSQRITVDNAKPTSKTAVVDQLGHKSSPQSTNKDPPLHRGTEPSTVPAAPPMPPPTSGTVPMSTRMPSSAPPTQSTFDLSAQTTLAQRATPHTAPSRSHQRAAEMLQASKLWTSAETNPGATGSINKSTIVSAQSTYNPVSSATGQNQIVNGASIYDPSASRLVNTPTATSSHPSTFVTASVTKVTAHTTPIDSHPSVGALGLHIPTLPTSVNIQSLPAPDLSRQQPIRSEALSAPLLDITSTAVMSTTAAKNAQQEQPVDSTRFRDVMPSANRNLTPPPHVYPISSRPSTSFAMTQHTHVTPVHPSSHHRVVSLPIAPSSSAVQKPPSPRKYSQPISSTTVSTQPFPSRLSAPESQSTRPLASGHVFTTAPIRPARPSPLDGTNEPDMLRTPSSIAPSPMSIPNGSAAVPQPTAFPIRARQSSTDSKDDKKKTSGLFGLFRTRTLSSKAVDPPVVSTVTRASLDQRKVHLDASVASPTTAPTPRGVTLTSATKESNPAPPPVAPTPIRVGLQSKSKGRTLDPIVNPSSLTQVAREHKDPTPHIFTPFKFLSMHSKRNRTVSAASLDVCDGNTATNTVVGSPDHSVASQAQPLPPIIPPDVRDPLVATSEWRDREEAERRERRTHRIRRPGVTFDVEEEPPSPSLGTTKRKKLVRRPSGRAGTPGPPRG